MHERIAEDLFVKAEADFNDAKEKAKTRLKAAVEAETATEAEFRKSRTTEVFKKNDLYDEDVADPADPVDGEM